MLGRRLELFKLFGTTIRIDLSWLLVVIFVTWSLAEGTFPLATRELWDETLSTTTYWLMGAAGALGLFTSVVLHELAHSLVALQRRMPIRGITLFIFGGIAEMTDEPPDPRSELMVALAGPFASALISLGCLTGAAWGNGSGWPIPILGVLGTVGVLNGLLMAFNLVPGFPLDGGRILRSVLWHWKHNLRWATRVASRIGAGFASVLMALGVISVALGDVVGGLWWLLLGGFLRTAALLSYRRLLLRRTLAGEPIRRFMNQQPVTVPRFIPIRELVDTYVDRHPLSRFPVVEDGRLVGCVTTRALKALPPEEWDRQSAGAIAEPCSRENTAPPDADALGALAKMSRSGLSRLMVVDGDRLIGVLALEDLLSFVAREVERAGEG